RAAAVGPQLVYGGVAERGVDGVRLEDWLYEVALVEVDERFAELPGSLPLAGAGDEFAGDFNADAVRGGEVGRLPLRQRAVGAALVHTFAGNDGLFDGLVLEVDDVVVAHPQRISAVVAGGGERALVVEQRVAPQPQDAARHVGEVAPDVD